MGADYHTVVFMKEDLETSSIILRQIAELSILMNNFKRRGMRVPSILEPANRLLDLKNQSPVLSYQGYDLYSFSDGTMHAFGMYSRHNDVRDLVRLSAFVPFVLLESCSDWAEPKIKRVLGFGGVEATIPDTWDTVNFVHSDWIALNLKEIKDFFDN